MPSTKTSSHLSTTFTIILFCSMFALTLLFLQIRNQIDLLRTQLNHSNLPPTPIQQLTDTWPLYQNSAQNFSIRILPSLYQGPTSAQIITAVDVDFWISWKSDLVALDIIIDSRPTQLSQDPRLNCFGNQQSQQFIQNRPSISCSSNFVSSFGTGTSLNYYIQDKNRLIRLWATSQDSNQISLLDLNQILSSFQFIN